MNKYHVYFEIYGKKMKATVEATSFKDAKDKVKDKIIFHKVEPVDDFFEHLKRTMGL